MIKLVSKGGIGGKERHAKGSRIRKRREEVRISVGATLIVPRSARALARSRLSRHAQGTHFPDKREARVQTLHDLEDFSKVFVLFL